MRNTLKTTFVFLAGAAVGSAITWKLVKDMYERISQEEIESVKETWRRKYDAFETESKNDEASVTAIMEEIKTISQKAGYTRYSELSGDKGSEEEETVMEKEKPYVIPPEEYGENEDYEKVSLTYFYDGILMEDETSEVIEDIDDTIGEGSLSTFGMYEADSVFVRNDARQCDYEILADERSYEEFIETRGRR